MTTCRHLACSEPGNVDVRVRAFNVETQEVVGGFDVEVSLCMHHAAAACLAFSATLVGEISGMGFSASSRLDELEP